MVLNFKDYKNTFFKKSSFYVPKIEDDLSVLDFLKGWSSSKFVYNLDDIFYIARNKDKIMNFYTNVIKFFTDNRNDGLEYHDFVSDINLLDKHLDVVLTLKIEGIKNLLSNHINTNTILEKLKSLVGNKNKVLEFKILSTLCFVCESLDHLHFPAMVLDKDDVDCDFINHNFENKFNKVISEFKKFTNKYFPNSIIVPPTTSFTSEPITCSYLIDDIFYVCKNINEFIKDCENTHIIKENKLGKSVFIENAKNILQYEMSDFIFLGLKDTFNTKDVKKASSFNYGKEDYTNPHYKTMMTTQLQFLCELLDNVIKQKFNDIILSNH